MMETQLGLHQGSIHQWRPSWVSTSVDRDPARTMSICDGDLVGSPSSFTVETQSGFDLRRSARWVSIESIYGDPFGYPHLLECSQGMKSKYDQRFSRSEASGAAGQPMSNNNLISSILGGLGDSVVVAITTKQGYISVPEWLKLRVQQVQQHSIASVASAAPQYFSRALFSSHRTYQTLDMFSVRISSNTMCHDSATSSTVLPSHSAISTLPHQQSLLQIVTNSPASFSLAGILLFSTESPAHLIDM
ncbi:hypothetical protein ACOSQ2_017550 [Xanthoceras sorbifolium]